MKLSFSKHLLLPPGVSADGARLLLARGLRAFGDGFVSLLLPYYLSLLGFGALQIGAIVTATLLGSGVMTLGVGLIAHRFRQRTLLRAAAMLMIATGAAFALATDFWPLLLIAAIGTMNPSTGDVSVFSPIEHALLTRTVGPAQRTALFARYALIGTLTGAIGAQCAGLPMLATSATGIDVKRLLQLMFLLYGALGFVALLLYRRLSSGVEPHPAVPSSPLGVSKRRVYLLAAVFSIDSLGGGLVVQSLLALWLFERFQLSVAVAGTIFFWTGMLGAFSQLAAGWLAQRIGLINTMVFTHLPANMFLILVPFMPNLPLALVFLMLRFALSQMDIPVRTAYVMAVVTPGERPAAASVTAVPRSLAAAVSPMIAGWLLTLSPFGWPLVLCGMLKIVYDLLLLSLFRHVRPSAEAHTTTTLEETK